VKTLADENISTAPSLEDILRRWAGGDGQYPINFLLSESDFKKIPAWKVLQNKVTDGSLRGKTVFVGITSSLLAEKHATPLGLMPGVLVHADEYIALASDRRLKSAPEAAVDGVAWLVSLGLLLVFLSRKVWWAVLAALGALFLSFIAAQIALSKDWLIHPFILLAGPVLALVTGVAAELLFLFLEKRGLEKKVIHDKMTGLYTYDYLRLRLDDEWKRCLKLQLPVSVAMTDLDRFKKINDTLGHETGNRMILRAADVIRQSVRGYDVVSRYGGDEFVILLWHADLNEARAYRERLRKQYEAMAAKLEEPLLKVSSVSIGVASFDPKVTAGNPATPQELVEKADQDLFRDKESRRKPGEPSR
jgi:diguanylate cyclase (GGDEF)-like protein